MINAAKALADLEAMPGSLIALPKEQMAEVLRELAAHQQVGALAMYPLNGLVGAGA